LWSLKKAAGDVSFGSVIHPRSTSSNNSEGVKLHSMKCSDYERMDQRGYEDEYQEPNIKKTAWNN